MGIATRLCLKGLPSGGSENAEDAVSLLRKNGLVINVNEDRREDKGTLSDLKNVRLIGRRKGRRASAHLIMGLNLCVGMLVYGIRLLCDYDLQIAQEMILKNKFWYPNPGGMIDISYRVRVS